MMENVQILCRCKDCRHGETEWGGRRKCHYWAFKCEGEIVDVDGDDFCSNGEPENN